MVSTLKLFFLCFTLVRASRCPETRKPHVTSCSIFYECINLPDSGYVWAPSKCPEGLVFQPYLRLCVLPGDSWTCNEPSTTVSTDFTPLYTPELLDNTKNSYHGLNANSADSSPDSKGLLNLGNLNPIIPHPLIEIDKSSKGQLEEKSPQIQQEASNDSEQNKMSKFHELSRLFFYQNVGPLRQTFLTSPIIDISSNEYFIQSIHNYILNKTMKGRINNKTMKNYPSTTENTVTSETEPSFTAATEILLNDELIDDTNNIVAIKGNLGHREYVTIENYKSLSSQVNIKVIGVIPCTTGIRLPNNTNCMKYYTCEPKTAELHDFTCPQHTAFNAQINLCDPQKFKSCMKKSGELRTIESPIVNEDKRNSSDDNPCEKTGKFVDKSSEKFYYLCYINGSDENIAYVRLSCPNDLIFCEERKVCTSKRFCSASDLR